MIETIGKTVLFGIFLLPLLILLWAVAIAEIKELFRGR